MPPERRTPNRPTAPSLLPMRLSLIMLVNCPCSELLQDRMDGPCACQAARTELRNLSTSIFRRLLSPDNDCAAESTWVEAEPVSEAPRCTSVMLEETCWVPCAACCTLREISCVAAPCSSTAE